MAGPATILVADDDRSIRTVLTQAPEGPPYEARCAIRPGDRLYLLRYRDRQFLGQAGPFVVPMRVWLPMVRR